MRNKIIFEHPRIFSSKKRNLLTKILGELPVNIMQKEDYLIEYVFPDLLLRTSERELQNCYSLFPLGMKKFTVVDNNYRELNIGDEFPYGSSNSISFSSNRGVKKLLCKIKRNKRQSKYNFEFK